MSDMPPPVDASRDRGLPPDNDSPGRTPRWVKVFGAIMVLVILLFAILMFTRGPGGQHGPGRHMQSGGVSETLASGTMVEHTPARGGRS